MRTWLLLVAGLLVCFACNDHSFHIYDWDSGIDGYEDCKQKESYNTCAYKCGLNCDRLCPNGYLVGKDGIGYMVIGCK